MKDEQENVSSEIENDPKYLQKLFAAYTMQHASSSSRQKRLEELLQRSSTKKLDEKKKNQMLKRLETAKIEKDQSLVFIEQIKTHAEKLGFVLGD